MDETLIQVGWCVMFSDGFTAFFKDRTTAENYAVKSHGILEKLYLSNPHKTPSETIKLEAEARCGK